MVYKKAQIWKFEAAILVIWSYLSKIRKTPRQQRCRASAVTPRCRRCHNQRKVCTTWKSLYLQYNLHRFHINLQQYTNNNAFGTLWNGKNTSDHTLVYHCKHVRSDDSDFTDTQHTKRNMGLNTGTWDMIILKLKHPQLLCYSGNCIRRDTHQTNYVNNSLLLPILHRSS